MARIEIRQRSKPQFPLLEQMRAERDERYACVVAPLAQWLGEKDGQLRAAWDEIRQLLNANSAFKKLLSTGMWDRIRDKIESDLSRALRMAIHEAVNEAAAKAPEFDRFFVEIKIPADLRDLHPSSIEHAILEKFMTQYDLELDMHEEFGAPHPLDDDEPVSETKVMHRLDVRVPSVSYTHMICDLHRQAERGFRD